MKRLFILLLACLTISLNAQEKKENRHDQIESQKIAFFTSELELTPEEAQLFWPIYNQSCKESDDAHWATVRALKALKKGVKDGKSSDEIAKLIDQYREACENEYLVQTKKPTYENVLSTEKLAKLYIAEDKFRWMLFKQIYKTDKPKNHNNQPAR